jgi:hypothetical protein
VNNENNLREAMADEPSRSGGYQLYLDRGRQVLVLIVFDSDRRAGSVPAELPMTGDVVRRLIDRLQAGLAGLYDG